MNNNTQKPQCGTDCGQKFEKELEKQGLVVATKDEKKHNVYSLAQ